MREESSVHLLRLQEGLQAKVQFPEAQRQRPRLQDMRGRKAGEDGERRSKIRFGTGDQPRASYPPGHDLEFLAKPFPCVKCGRSYKNKGSLKRHLHDECGKTPQYICGICGKGFKQKTNFQRHNSTVHRHIFLLRP
ncbi:hypothetical protein KM043_007704 [Ampulex compressa]|nr:hypothetical protein KM043_007704 [Ampulex compressa]